MQHITEAMISAWAPNAAAAANGRSLSVQGRFVRRERSEDDTFYLGECKGSGQKNYISSIDFLDPAQPVFHCSCPSRQVPCKHTLGLLYEMLARKYFFVCEIPPEAAQKRRKKQERAEQAESAADQPVSAAPRRINKAARAKKIQKQLEGLDITAQLIAELLRNGLGAMGQTALASYRELIRQLGDYYLPGPQRLLQQLVLEIAAFQQDGLDTHYAAALQVLVRLQTLVKKARSYLSAKLASGAVEQDDNLLYEELGGVWKLSELAELGLAKSEAQLVQLSFRVEYDAARAEYIDTGCWMDLDSGELSLTQNFRPLKALSHMKADDTVFEVAQIPLLCYYPGTGSRRVRWDRMLRRPLTDEDRQRLCGFATPLAPALKTAKSLLMNPLADPLVYALIRFRRIGRTAEGAAALEDDQGNSVLLADAPGVEPSLARLELLPPPLWEQQVIFGAFFYAAERRRLFLQPLALLTPQQLVRLLY